MAPIRAISRNRGGGLLKILKNGHSEEFKRHRRRRKSSHIRINNYYFENGGQVRRDRGFQGGRRESARRCEEFFYGNNFWLKYFVKFIML